MIGFFFKKNFYEGWDNVMLLALPNLIWDVFIGISAALVYAGVQISTQNHELSLTGIIIFGIAALIFFLSGGIFSLAWAENAVSLTSYNSVGPKDFFTSLKKCIGDGILYGLLLLIVTVFYAAGLIFYFGQKEVDITGLLAGSIFAWIGITIYMGLFWYPSLRALLKGRFLKTIKKCFIFLFDNLGKSIVLGIYNLFLFALSVILIGLVPGMTGIGLARCNMSYLALKKYDWIDELKNKGEKIPTYIPWADILKEDIEITGSRTVKQFFFPWKDN